MLINFCNSDLVTNISSSVCECDGYNVKNLISKVELERRRGFLADSFIKPPITIDFQFVCEIQLSHIILWTRVGGQKSVGVDLYASNRACTLQSIGCAFINNNKDDGFIFFKHGENSVKGIDTSNFVVKTFKSMNLMRVQNIQIKILKTLASSVPALQRVEIWGNIHRSCPKKTVDFVKNAWARMKNVNSFECDKAVENNYKKCSDVVSDNIRDIICNPSQFQVPDEFLDPITCEIITIPMILPSGKIIDNSTLERFIKEEEKWGRFPSDPFTGKLFSESNRPKVSTALKIRIDKFLLDNSDKSFSQNLPRTIGNSQPFLRGAKESSLISGMKHKTSSSETFSSTSSNTNFNLKLDIVTKTDGYKKRKLSFSNHVVPLDGKDKVANDSEFHPRKPEVDSSKGLLKYNFVSLDKIKEQSLDSSLKTILSNLPSFTKNSCSDDYTIVCFKCKSGSILYKLPCEHHVCRLCLSAMIETNSCTCMICSTGFNSSDPKRVHLKNF